MTKILNYHWFWNLAFGVFLKSWANLTRRKPFSNTVRPRTDNSGTKSSLRNCAYGQIRSMHFCFLYTHLDFDGPASFLTLAKHMFLLWSEKLPKHFGYENTHMELLLWSNRQSLSKCFLHLGYKNQIRLACIDLTMIKMFSKPRLKMKGAWNLSLLSLGTFFYRVDWNRTMRKSKAAQCQWKKIRIR